MQEQKEKLHLDFSMENYYYNQVHSKVKDFQFGETKVNNLKEKFSKFENLKNIDEAKRLAEELFSIENEYTEISERDITCTILDKKDFFRIVMDSPRELKAIDYV